MFPGHAYQKDVGVRFWQTPPEVLEALAKATAIYGAFNLPLVVTSMNDSKHRIGSLHYVGRAFDCRSKTVPRDKLDNLIGQLRRALGPRFDVILEDRDGPNEHAHIELDPKIDEV